MIRNIMWNFVVSDVHWQYISGRQPIPHVQYLWFGCREEI